MEELTELIAKANAGDLNARNQLFAAAYPELIELARSRLRNGGRPKNLDATSLVHESYLRLLSDRKLRIEDRRGFFAYASSVMRSVLVNSVREHMGGLREGDLADETLDTSADAGLFSEEDERVLGVHDAILALEAEQPRLAKVAEMRYFGGYSQTEIAEVLDITERTAGRELNRARLLLGESLRSAAKPVRHQPADAAGESEITSVLEYIHRDIESMVEMLSTTRAELEARPLQDPVALIESNVWRLIR